MLGQQVIEVQRVYEDLDNGQLIAEPMYRVFVSQGEFERSEWANPVAGYRVKRHTLNGDNSVVTTIVWECRE